MPLPFLDPGGGEGVEGDPDRVFGFAWLRKNTKAFAEEFANREIERRRNLFLLTRTLRILGRTNVRTC